MKGAHVTVTPDNESSAPPESAPKKRSRAARLFRFLIRASFLLFLLAGAAGVALFFLPLKSARAERRIKEAFEDATGLRLEFARAAAYLSRGEAEIESPAIFDPATNQKLLELDRVEAQVEIASIWRSWRGGDWLIEIPRVSVAGPLDLRFEDRDGAFRPAENLQLIMDIVETRRKSAAAVGSASSAPRTGSAPRKAPFRVAQVDLTNFELNLISIDPQGAARPEFALRGVNALAEFGESFKPANIIATGRMEGVDGHAPVNVRVRPRAQSDEYSFDLTIHEFDSARHLLFPPSRRITLGRATAEGVIRRESEGVWSVVSSARSPELTLAGTGLEGADERLSEVSLYSTLRWIGPDRRVACEMHDFKSREATASGAGWLELSGDRRWEVNLEPLRVFSGGLALVESRVFQDKYLVLDAAPAPIPIPDPDGPPRPAPEPPPEVQIRGRVAGRYGDKTLSALEVSYQASGLTLVFPELLEPISRLRLAGKANLDQINLDEGFLVFQGVPVNVSGQFHGKVQEAKIDSIELAWQTTGQVAGISDLIQKNNGKGRADLSFRGEVTGKGTIRVKSPEAGRWADALKQARIEGEIAFNQAELTYTGFKPPVRDLRGGLRVGGSRAEFLNISGRVEDVPFTVSGALVGEGQFWQASKLDLSVDGSARIEDAPRIFAWFDRAPPKDWPEARGTVSVKGTLRGAAKDWRALDYDLNVTGRDLSIALEQFESEWVAGKVEFPRLEVAMTPQRIKIAPAEGAWGMARARIEADLTPDSGDLRARLSGELTEMRKLVPEGLNRFDLGGLATVTHQVALTRLDKLDRPIARFADFLPEAETKAPAEPTPKPSKKKGKAPKLTPIPSPSPAPAPVADPDAPPEWLKNLKETWSARNNGEIEVAGAEVTHESFPTHVTGWRGKALYDDKHLWTPAPLAATLGANAVNTFAEGSITFGEVREGGEPTIIEAKVSGEFLDIDEWIDGWGDKTNANPRPPKPGAPPKPDVRSKPRLIVKVTGATDSLNYKGLRGRNLSGGVEYQYLARNQFKLFVRDARARDATGSVLVNGRIENLKEYQQNEWMINGENMNAADVVKTFFGIDNQSGLTSGLVTGNLHLIKEGPRDTPMGGSCGFVVRDSRFVSNAVLGGLGRLLRIEDLFTDITFSEIQGSFELVDGAANFTGDRYVRLSNPSLLYPIEIKAQGTAGPASRLDMNLTLQFLPAVSKAPVVGRVWDLINTLTGKLLRYRVHGTLREPNFDILPIP